VKTAAQLSKASQRKLLNLDRALHRAYGAPERTLGNRKDPLEEAIYILLSFQTNLSRFRQTFARLRRSFRTFDDLDRAPVRQVAMLLRSGGLHHQKARIIKRLLREVRKVAGTLSLDFLQKLTDQEAERSLIHLPGISWKAARCILLYSLGRNAFPVDVNTFRILKRTGVLPLDAVYRAKPLHDALQSAVAPDRRKALHVNLVIHGQRTCIPLQPKCSSCDIRRLCPRKGLRKGTATRHA